MVWSRFGVDTSDFCRYIKFLYLELWFGIDTSNFCTWTLGACECVRAEPAL